MSVKQYVCCCIPQKGKTKVKKKKRTIIMTDGIPVEALSWDITLGIAGTSFGAFILNATSESEEVSPDSIDHTGIKVFGHLYEYGDLGVLKTEIPPDPPEDYEIKSKYPAFSLRSTELMGYTTKTQEEFEAWVEEQNNGDFQGSNYNVIDRSCVVFARLACQYLSVPHPENWDHIISWAIKNKKFTSLVGMAGLNSRHVQHKTTEYVTHPSKIKDKVKRMYRKIKPKKKNKVKRDLSAVEDGQEIPPTDEIVEGEEEEEETDDDDDDEEDDSDSHSETGDHEKTETPNQHQTEENTENSTQNPVPNEQTKPDI